jgi:uncharacterized protein (TIGR00369 family)
MWQVDLGDLQGGSIGGLTIASGKVYVSGTTTNATLDAGGAAATANLSQGGTEAFVFGATDNGASATPDWISYIGTGSAEQGGGVTVAGGKIYLTGTTTGTFAGETRSVINTHNLFVAQLAMDGTPAWAHQYGGRDGESRGLAIASDNAGASVLDALKLTRGKIDVNQSNAIASQTTARVGDFFTLKVDGRTGTRSVKITLGKGETLRSLAVKINGALLFDGKATALPVKGGQALKIAVNPGVRVQLIAGPKDFDALEGLGLAPLLLTNDKTDAPVDKTKVTDNAVTNAAKASAAASATVGAQTIGLGIDGGLGLLTKQTAQHADVALQGAMALIGAELAELAPGYCAIAVVPRAEISQQHGYVHAGVISSIADSACGYAAMTLAPSGAEVLTVEFKISLLAPADGLRFLATAAVLRAGKRLSFCSGEVRAIRESSEELIATMLSTIITKTA